MTGSTWVDIIVIGVALLAASSGWRQGAVASAMAFLGVVLGAVAGILIAPHVLDYVDGLHGAGLRFLNPNADHDCGCGASFAAAEG